MMNTLLALLLIGGLQPPAISPRHADAAEVAHWDFGTGSDADFDLWPDEWTRRAGVAYPRYLKIEISQEPSAGDDRCLRMNLDGGAAAVYSPPISVGPQFSYVLDASLRTERLVRDVAYVSLTFYDAQQQQLSFHTSDRLRATDGWQRIGIGPVAPPRDNVHTAVIGLHLEPRDLRTADLTGAALFDEIWLGRLPRVTLAANSSHNVYTQPEEIEVTCEVSGIPVRDPLITFELIGVEGELLASKKEPLQGEAFSTRDQSPTGRPRISPAEPDPAMPDPAEHGYCGKMSWQPPVVDYGYYLVRVTMSVGSRVMQQREMPLAVIRPSTGDAPSEFGWSLPQGDQPLGLGPLADLLGQVGIGWAKFPVWYREDDTEWGNQLARFVERLNGQGIEVVGMLDGPPEELADRFATVDQLLAATIFAEPELWHPMLHPIMTRLSLKVRWWQLGSDQDTSFIGHPDLSGKIAEVKRQLERFGRDVKLGLGWKWLYVPPATDRAESPFDFLSYTSDPPLTKTELAEYLGRTKTPGVARWATIQPLANDEYDLQQRARDLVGRMLAAKRARIDCLFVPAPFDPRHGLMRPEGTPGDLLLPWRTTSLMISGRHFIGRLTLPGGSENMVFADDRDAVMVVWNDRPTVESLYLGENVRQVDLWGRSIPTDVDGHRQVITASTLPTFITGVHLPIARWRISFRFDEQQLSSVFGRPQTASFALNNPFEHGVGGKVTVITPETWEIDSPTHQFRLAADEEFNQAFPVELKPNANSGPQDLRVDFEVTADRNYRFSAYRTINVGLGDVVVELTTRLNDQDELVVEQRLENKTGDFVSFNCLLFTPDRRHLRRQVLDQPRGRNVQTYVLPNGHELLGKNVWLRAEEIGGDRVLSYRITVAE